jgi:transposase-like protein
MKHCPVCNREMVEKTVPNLDATGFHCETCKEYWVALTEAEIAEGDEAHVDATAGHPPCDAL